jgi:hypothetical protein
MVEQTQANGLRPVRDRPAAAGAAIAEATRHRLLLIGIAMLLTPGTFVVAGTLLSPYRLYLIVLFPLLLRCWLLGAAGRQNSVDILVLLSAGWAMLSLLMNHGLSMGPRAVLICLEFFGGYLLGRVLIQTRKDFETFIRYLFWAFLVLAPFVFIELLTGFNLLKALANLVMNTPVVEKAQRLGFTRVQGPLEHPILFGLVASFGLANAYYVLGKSRAAFFFLMVFSSLSSGPFFSALIQLFLIAWDRVLTFLAGMKWMLLVYIAVLIGFALAIASGFNVIDFLLQNLMFDPRTAAGRFINLEWGIKEVLNNPVFGIGLNGWERPWWRQGQGSLDNFWLAYSMRYGIPALAFLVLAGLLTLIRIATRSGLSPEVAEYRKGYLFALGGVAVTLGTVFIWNATSVFVLMYLGAGAWFCLQPRMDDPREAAARARRAAQVRVFDAAPLPPPAAAGRGISQESAR